MQPWPTPPAPELAARAAQGLPYTLFCSRFGDGRAFAAWRQALAAGAGHRLIVCTIAWPEDGRPASAPAGWPAETSGLHLLDFAAEPGSAAPVRLLLAQGLAEPWRAWRQLRAQALFVDPAFPVPAAALARMAAPGALLSWPGASAAEAEALRRAGFVADTAAAGQAGGWRFAPRAPQRAEPERRPGEALVIGAGIAGASAAAALAARGWRCTVLDAAPHPAAGASGNPAGIVHGTVHAQDGPHARYTRAAALHAQRLYARLLAQGVPGALQGLLRAGADPDAPPPPPAWAQAWGAAQLAGSGLRADNAWFFPGAGWVSPVAVVRALLAAPGLRFVGGQAVAGLLPVHAADAGPPRWRAVDSAGQTLAEAPVAVLAQGGHWQPLLAGTGALVEPVLCARGQVTWFEHAGTAPRWPLAGGGYCLAPEAGKLLCGATTQAEPLEAMGADTNPRAADHAFNLQRLAQQTGIAPPPGTALHGRVGWRLRALDKLPFVGPLADAGALALRGDARAQPRLFELARVPGLFCIGAMAGRGFTWGPLAGELLASWIDGSVMPVESALVDALDPARLWLRRVTRPGRQQIRPG